MPTLEETTISVEMISSENIGADLTNEVFRNRTVYFSAPEPYLGKRLTSYGGVLNYSIFYTPGLFGRHLLSSLSNSSLVYRGVLFLTFEGLESSLNYKSSSRLCQLTIYNSVRRFVHSLMWHLTGKLRLSLTACF